MGGSQAADESQQVPISKGNFRLHFYTKLISRISILTFIKSFCLCRSRGFLFLFIRICVCLVFAEGVREKYEFILIKQGRRKIFWKILITFKCSTNNFKISDFTPFSTFDERRICTFSNLLKRFGHIEASEW